MKKKVYLIGICLLVVLIAFSYGVINKLRKTKDYGDVIKRDGDMIKVAEAIELSTHLGLSGEIIEEVIGYDSKKDGDKFLAFGEMKSIIESASISLDIKKSDIIKQLTFDVEEEKDNKGVLVAEFLNFFETAVELSYKLPMVEKKNVFILGTTQKDNKNLLVTDGGRFTYNKALDFSGTDHVFNSKSYTDKKVRGYFNGEQLIFVEKVLEEAAVLHNVYITFGEGGEVSTYLHDMAKVFPTKYNLSGAIEGKIGDLVIEEGKVVKIVLKPDSIMGKVLTTASDSIEIEKFGKLELDSNFRIYRIYGELGMEPTNSILVGYSNTDFIVADGKIVAALIKEPIQAKNIRVLIKTNQFADLFHEELRFTSDRNFTVMAGEEVVHYKKGEEAVFGPEDELFKEGRVYIKPDTDQGKMELLSVKRQDGNPKYRGTMELSLEEGGLVLINDISIEEYLYGVVPSEMPNYFGVEALKVQAICARSYAYKQLFLNAYREYGAHVDDSVSYQVYNNIKETEESILAVKDTYGKVIEYAGDVITAYYFSTSSGHTSSVWEVWGGGEELAYLTGKPQTKYDYVDGAAVYVANMEEPMDLSTEDAFGSFLEEAKDTTYDSEFPWYRWKVTLSLDEITQSVDKSLGGRYKAVPNNILTLVKGNPKDGVYESQSISSIGTVTDVIVGKRAKSGILEELILVGTKNTIKVISEYNIRALLAPTTAVITRQDDSTVQSQSLLPSAFFAIKKGENAVTLHGGGYGHGVGMSQNGVKAMTDSGKGYEEIIRHYYTGVELGYIYK